MLVRQKIAGIIRRGRSNSDPFVIFICTLIFLVYMFGSTPIDLSSSEKAASDGQMKQNESPLLKAASANQYVNKTEPTYSKERQTDAARIAMGPCRPIYGKVTILVAVVTSSYQRFYNVAQDSLHCYLKSTNYTFLLVNLDTDKRVNEQCGHNQVYYSNQLLLSNRASSRFSLTM